VGHGGGQKLPLPRPMISFDKKKGGTIVVQKSISNKKELTENG
jgi:hypothetical protein